MRKNMWIAAVMAVAAMIAAIPATNTQAADNALRFPPLPVEKMTPEQKAQMGQNYDPVGFVATMLRNPKLAGALQTFADAVLVRRDKTRRQPQYLDELAIMMAAKFWRNQPNYVSHAQSAKEAGASEAAMNAVAKGKKQPGMKPDEEVVFDFGTELFENRAVSDATFKRAVATLGEDGVVSLIGAMGMYQFMSMIINVAGVPKPPVGSTPAPFSQAQSR